MIVTATYKCKACGRTWRGLANLVDGVAKKTAKKEAPANVVEVDMCEICRNKL